MFDSRHTAMLKHILSVVIILGASGCASAAPDAPPAPPKEKLPSYCYAVTDADASLCGDGKAVQCDTTGTRPQKQRQQADLELASCMPFSAMKMPVRPGAYCCYFLMGLNF